MTEEKQGFFKKSWKYIVTSVTSIAVGVGVTIGADAAKVQETLTKAQANQIVAAAAVYSAEYAVNQIKLIKTEENKKEAIANAVKATTAASEDIIKGVTETKEIIQNAVKEDTTVSKETAKTTTDTKTTETKATTTETK